jgi:hypothetical protein
MIGCCQTWSATSIRSKPASFAVWVMFTRILPNSSDPPVQTTRRPSPLASDSQGLLNAVYLPLIRRSVAVAVSLPATGLRSRWPWWMKSRRVREILRQGRTSLCRRVDSARDLTRYFLMRETSDIPKISFFREGGPNREPRELVAGFLDGTLDRLLLSLPSFE